jgi:hypothetical protein
MKVSILRVRLSHLRNSEYCMFVSQLVAIFSKFNAELLHLKKTFDRILALIPELDKVRAQDQDSEFSNLIHQLDVQRSQIFNALVKQVKNLGSSGLKSFSSQLDLLNRLLDKHGRDISGDGQNAKTKRLNDFLSDITASPGITAAVSTLHLTLFVDELRTANTEFASKYILRTETKAEAEIVDSEAIRSETNEAITTFFDAFELYSLEYDDVDYASPAAKINELTSHYKTELKARDTRRKNGKNTNTEDPITPKA